MATDVDVGAGCVLFALLPLFFFVTRDEDSDVSAIRLFFDFFEDDVVVVVIVDPIVFFFLVTLERGVLPRRTGVFLEPENRSAFLALKLSAASVYDYSVGSGLHLVEAVVVLVAYQLY